MAASLSCSKCHAGLPAEAVEGGSFQCPSCQCRLRVEAFPALLQEVKTGGFGERVLMEGESTCFYHGAKKASVICDGCGRFLCALCDIEMAGEHLCPGCLEGGRGQAGKKIEPERVIYEDAALGAAALGLIIGPLAVISSSVAVFIALRHWNKPQKIGAVGKVKKVIALLIAIGLVGLWAFVLVGLLST